MKTLAIMHPSHWEQALGGAELQISYIAAHASAQGYDVHLIFEDDGQPVVNREGFRLHPLKRKAKTKRFGRIWFLYAPQIYRRLSRIRPDVIYTRSYSSWSGMAASYAHKQGIPHIWALASDQEVKHTPLLGYIKNPLNIIERMFISRAFALASRIIVQNRFQQKVLSAKFGRTGSLIHQMTPRVRETSIRKSRSPISIVWVGNLKPVKQPELFIQLAGRFAEDNDLSFKMVGRMMNPRYEQMIDRASKNGPNFSYLGYLPNGQVNELLLGAHILVNTSKFEGFSNTFVQAWMRKVVVLSMNSNPNKILTTGQIGFLCQTAPSLDDTIRQLCRHPERLKEMGEAAYQYAIQTHTLEVNMPEVFSLIENKSPAGSRQRNEQPNHGQTADRNHDRHL